MDWNPTPPDKNMGMWREVFLSSSGKVALRAPFVTSKPDPNYKTAELTLSAEVRNATDQSVNAFLHAEIDAIRVSQPVELAARQTKVVTSRPSSSPDSNSPIHASGGPTTWANPILHRTFSAQ